MIDLGLWPEFREASWRGWRERVLNRLTPGVRELWVAAGRGAGKSRVAALLAASWSLRSWPRSPGESIYVAVLAPDRAQATLTLGYVRALLPDDVIEPGPERRDSISLINGNVIEVVTAKIASPRGRSYSLVIVEESAFLPPEDSANPDTEIIRAVRPGLARVPGSLLVVISSPWARRGELFKAFEKWGASGGDAEHVFVQAATRDLNPTFSATEITRAELEDPISAATEYGAAFRSDLETLLPFECLDACIDRSRPLDLPRGQHRYYGFVDPSGGSADSFTAAIAHCEGTMRVLDATYERRPPFSPEEVTGEISALLFRYGVTRVTGDRYAGEWPREQFRKRGISYEPSDRTKSEIYVASVPLFRSGVVSIPSHPRLISQLSGLERRVARGGRESVDHAPGAHDDVANATCGALLLAETSVAARGPHTVPVLWG